MERGSVLGVRAEPEWEVTMRRKLILVTIMMALVRVVIASASPVVDAVLVALAVLLFVRAWDEFTNA
jgi:phosphate starvation-inducible membrane PsiE